MNYYNADPTADKVRKIKSEVDKVQDIMMENIENVLKRGERLDDLLDATDRLATDSAKWSQGAGRLHGVMWLKNMRLNIAIAGVGIALLIIVFLFILMLACGGITFRNC
eukprot:TRINITY_DN2220_c0_g1_i1.p1 TRINITY_DN2220_c0_g1~~TRINITY_DN2220_c0_g1_i1.p1  ORF type:complete len:109 (+),score=20.60 TRINITY_DN2220_c0_g1_i1:388-714(+)